MNSDANAVLPAQFTAVEGPILRWAGTNCKPNALGVIGRWESSARRKNNKASSAVSIKIAYKAVISIRIWNVKCTAFVGPCERNDLNCFIYVGRRNLPEAVHLIIVLCSHVRTQNIVTNRRVNRRWVVAQLSGFDGFIKLPQRRNTYGPGATCRFCP
jgi:hypothetical protein